MSGSPATDDPADFSARSITWPTQPASRPNCTMPLSRGGSPASLQTGSWRGSRRRTPTASCRADESRLHPAAHPHRLRGGRHGVAGGRGATCLENRLRRRGQARGDRRWLPAGHTGGRRHQHAPGREAPNARAAIMARTEMSVIRHLRIAGVVGAAGERLVEKHAATIQKAAADIAAQNAREDAGLPPEGDARPPAARVPAAAPVSTHKLTSVPPIALKAGETKRAPLAVPPAGMPALDIPGDLVAAALHAQPRRAAG